MVPIPKNSNPLYLNNLRPISLLLLPGKLFEKIIHTRLSNYFENNNLFCENQGGFRQGMDTTQTIYELSDYINTGFNSKKNFCLAAFADLAKAFDSLERSLLVKKLYLYGIRGSILKLLVNYLSNRKQQVNLNGKFSELKPINYGVPQGSILGPLLFIIFINDLPIHNFNCQILIYADDTVLFFKHEFLNQAVNTLQQDLIFYQDWCLFNRLSLNISKTKLMLFVDNKKRVPDKLLIVTLNNAALNYVDEFNYLGVKLDMKLRFQSHFFNIMSRLNHKMILLSKIRPFVDSRTALIMYKAHPLSLVEYGAIFFDSLPVNYLNKLQRIQNRCLRICFLADQLTSNVSLHLRAKLMPLRFRRQEAICKFVFKKIRHSPGILCEPIRHGNRSSFKQLIKLITPKSNRFRNSLSYTGLLAWNNLPESLRMINDYHSFKKSLKKYMYTKFWEDGFV